MFDRVSLMHQPPFPVPGREHRPGHGDAINIIQYSPRFDFNNYNTNNTNSQQTY
jgi:hypothetical protein